MYQAVVLAATEIQVWLRDRQVINRDHVAPLYGLDLDPAVEDAEIVAGFQVAGHRPALAADPEAVVGAWDQDRATFESESHGLAGGVVVRDHDRLEGERAGRGVLAEDPIAGADLLDRAGAAQGPDRGPTPAKQLMSCGGGRFGTVWYTSTLAGGVWRISDAA